MTIFRVCFCTFFAIWGGYNFKRIVNPIQNISLFQTARKRYNNIFLERNQKPRGSTFFRLTGSSELYPTILLWSSHFKLNWFYVPERTIYWIFRQSKLVKYILFWILSFVWGTMDLLQIPYRGLPLLPSLGRHYTDTFVATFYFNINNYNNAFINMRVLLPEAPCSPLKVNR
jgi:hypothetical protein